MNPQLEALQRRVGGYPIELPAAALMAGAVLLATIALPDWRFERAVAATGLPAILSAAQPPLGGTARVLAGLVLAAFAFALVWLGLRALDDEPEDQDDFPSFRAADLHPDAPRRRPILAGAEFGEPVETLPPIETQLARKRVVAAEPLPAFLEPRPVPAAEPTQAAEPVEAVVVTPAEAEADGPEPADAPFDVVAEPVRATDPFVAPAPKPVLPSFMSFDAFEEDLPSNSAIRRAAREPEPLGHLMERLETGLARNGGKPVPRSSAATTPATASPARPSSPRSRATG